MSFQAKELFDLAKGVVNDTEEVSCAGIFG